MLSWFQCINGVGIILYQTILKLLQTILNYIARGQVVNIFKRQGEFTHCHFKVTGHAH